MDYAPSIFVDVSVCMIEIYWNPQKLSSWFMILFHFSWEYPHTLAGNEVGKIDFHLKNELIFKVYVSGNQREASINQFTIMGAIQLTLTSIIIQLIQ